MKMVRLNEPEQMREAWQMLHDIGTMMVSFAAQVTHIPLLIVDPWRAAHVGYAQGFGYGGPLEGFHYVGYVEYGGLYPLTLGHLHAGYVREKLRFRTSSDASNSTAFLNCLGQKTIEAHDAYLKSLVLDGDHLDHNYYQENPGASR